MKAPDWLSQRGGEVKLASDGRSYYVYVDDQAQYRLVAIPVKGKYGCSITQTINGRQIPSSEASESKEGAVSLGLQDLGKYLGWV